MPVGATGLSQNGGSLLTYAVSRLRPDVFTHPIWAHFGDMEQPTPPESIDELLGAAKQLQKDDPASACQILLICAVNQNYAGQRYEAFFEAFLSIVPIPKVFESALFHPCQPGLQSGNLNLFPRTVWQQALFSSHPHPVHGKQIAL